MKRITPTFALFTLFIYQFFSACTPSNNKTEQQSGQDTTTLEIIGEELSYNSDSTTMKGYIARTPQEGKHPGVIVIHEWWGHNDYVRHRADMLAELGYVALAIDMYGDGKQANHPEDAGKFAGMVFSNMPEARARFEAALRTLKSNPNVDSTKIAVVGYCFGGSVALTMANLGYDLDAVAAFHSGVQLPVPPSADLKATVLVANGADDPFISSESVDAFKSQMDAVNANYRYISYPGTKHAYTSPAATEMGLKFNLPLEYNEESDLASWKELTELLKNTL